MEAVATTQIIKLIFMMLFIIAIFIVLAFLLKNRYFHKTEKSSATVLDNVYINNKERLINLQYKDSSYLIFINQSNCLLLDKNAAEPIAENNKEKSLNFKSIIESIYRR